MKIREGQCYWLHMPGIKEPAWVEVVKTGIEGIHSIKVRSVQRPNEIAYCKPEQLSTRKAKAAKKEPTPVMSESMKKEVQKQTEERMEQIMDNLEKQKKIAQKDLPDFDEVRDDFYAICTVLTDEKPDQRVKALAEAGLYEKIKYGVKRSEK